jgi:hypothetical protein
MSLFLKVKICESIKTTAASSEQMLHVEFPPCRLVRSCTKVIMQVQEMAVGRAVDLMRFTTYDELYAKLEEMFGLENRNISDKGTSV